MLDALDLFRCDGGKEMLERLILAIAITFLFYLGLDNSNYRTTSISPGVQLSISSQSIKEWR